jgi:hypothetical protein
MDDLANQVRSLVPMPKDNNRVPAQNDKAYFLDIAKFS